MINGQPVVEAQEKITIELTIDQKSEVQTMLYIQGYHGCRGEGGAAARGADPVSVSTSKASVNVSDCEWC